MGRPREGITRFSELDLDDQRLVRQALEEGRSHMDIRQMLMERGYAVSFRGIKAIIASAQHEPPAVADQQYARLALAGVLQDLHDLIKLYMLQAKDDDKKVRPLTELVSKFYDGLRLLHPIETRTSVYSIEAVTGANAAKQVILGNIERLQRQMFFIGASGESDNEPDTPSLPEGASEVASQPPEGI